MANSSGFWEDRGGHDNAGGAAYTFNDPKSVLRYHLARMLKKPGLQVIGELMATLNGVVAGSSASKTKSQVQAVQGGPNVDLGGSRTIESVEAVDLLLAKQPTTGSANTARVTTAADVTAIAGLFHGGAESSREPSTYPADASGNGGGGKQGTVPGSVG